MTHRKKIHSGGSLAPRVSPTALALALSLSLTSLDAPQGAHAAPRRALLSAERLTLHLSGDEEAAEGAEVSEEGGGGRRLRAEAEGLRLLPCDHDESPIALRAARAELWLTESSPRLLRLEGARLEGARLDLWALTLPLQPRPL